MASTNGKNKYRNVLCVGMSYIVNGTVQNIWAWWCKGTCDKGYTHIPYSAPTIQHIQLQKTKIEKHHISFGRGGVFFLCYVGYSVKVTFSGGFQQFISGGLFFFSLL